MRLRTDREVHKCLDSKNDMEKVFPGLIPFLKSKAPIIFRLFCLALMFFTLSLLAFHADLFEPDEVAHYSLNRSIPFNSKFLINPWGKPLFSSVSFGLIVLTNDSGLVAIRLFNVAVSVVICFIAYKLCRKLGLSDFWASLSIPLALTSPLFTKISFSALTEPLFSLMLISAFYLYYDGRFSLSSVIISLSCMARQEGFLLIPLWWVFLRKNKKAALLTLIFPLLWSSMLLLSHLPPFYMVAMYPNVLNPLVIQWEDTSMLGQGPYSLFYYVIKSPNILGPAILVLFLVGFFYDIKARNYLFLRICFLMYLLFHSLILVFPYFGSVGFLRHMYPMIPLATVFGASGLKKLSCLVSRMKPMRLNARKYRNVFLSVFLVSISLANLLLTTVTPYDRAVLIAASSSYNALQHEVGRFLVEHYPKDVSVFCPSSMFILQLYLTLPTLYWYKEHPRAENYTVIRLDGDFPLYSFNIHEDCPKGSLVVWNSDFVGSEFSPLRINLTRYAERLNMEDGLHRIIVYERL